MKKLNYENMCAMMDFAIKNDDEFSNNELYSTFYKMALWNFITKETWNKFNAKYKN